LDWITSANFDHYLSIVNNYSADEQCSSMLMLTIQ